MSIQQDLINFYNTTSKHSNYQVLPSSLRTILKSKDVDTKTRAEQARLAFILSNIDIKDKTVLDIGGNTGYFTFELLDAGAKSVHYYEGNKEHAEFVKLGAKALGITDRLKVTHAYYEFEDRSEYPYDAILLLNVLHHLGDDYGDPNISIESAKENIIKQLNSMAHHTKTLVFQMGFNWKGNPETCLFQNGTKEEMIEYVREGVKEKWLIQNIGIAEKTSKQIHYVELNDQNIKREDSMGEFLNRPLFILERRN